MESINLSHSCTNLFTPIYEKYVDVVSAIIKTIFCRSRAGDVLLEFLCEPITFIKSSYHYLIGRVDVETFHKNGLNPTNLKALKPHKVAILCIHGCMANPGTWIPLSKKIEEAGIGPAFTIDLNDKSWPWSYNTSADRFQDDVGRVGEWIDGIKKRYINAGLKVPELVIVGHSRGGKLGILQADRQDITSVITLGGSSWSTQRNNVYDIEGDYDRLSPPSSIQDSSHKETFKTTHLGLIYNEQVLDKVVKLISS